MKELCNSCKIDDSALVHYVIKCINERQENKTLYGCNNLAEFKEKMCESKVKTAPNCVSVKKDGLHMKGDQRTVTISPVVKVHVELQHPSELPELEDGLKRLEKPDSMI
ncbi:hypothetical protein TNIN_379901 [Trichonephila inaurata madagascariensis]|uniref:Uncharacterized protein n=1 Tax=Trichonephila inaurata madagascariensis TaxID=2747483 RepID=A0A8X7CKU1_9ARAC|nr:hypothetical protein TNIN_379901 [Trichonephila inaurata madagascariensis]